LWASRRNLGTTWPTFVLASTIILIVVGAVMGEQIPGICVIASVLTVLMLGFWSAALAASLRIHRLWRHLDRYATTLGGRLETLTYSARPGGILIARGQAGLSRTVITLPSGVRIGDWEYLRRGTQPGTNAAYTWGYISIPLAAAVPHLVLDSRRNQRVSAIGAGADLRRSQIISLEGDFDRHFTVYSPEGYGADALYFLTPDVMRDLIDVATDWDVEFIDDEVVFFRPGPILKADDAALDRLVAFAARWTQRAVAWSHWRDPRLDSTPRIDSHGLLVSPASGIHHSGARLDDSRLATIGIGVSIVLVVGMCAWTIIDMLQR